MPNARQYQEAQDASGLQVGDKVRVIRPAHDRELGWSNSWNGDGGMDDSIGEIGIIMGLWGGTGTGVQISFPNAPEASGFGYPFFILELVEPAPEVDEEEYE